MKIQIIINNKKTQARQGQTILEVARVNGIEIPALCFHSDLKAKASCRICVVEIKGRKGLHTSCSTKVEPGMEIITESPKISRTRKINLELIFTQHCEECHDCIYNFDCDLLKLAKKYKVKINKFIDRKKDFPVYKFGPALIFDSSKCINCGNCVEVCQNQAIGFLKTENKGYLSKICPQTQKDIKRWAQNSFAAKFCYLERDEEGKQKYLNRSIATEKMFLRSLTKSQLKEQNCSRKNFATISEQGKARDCIFCGQCAVHCPVGAFEGVGEFEDIEKPLLDKGKVVVFQFAPAIRTSIGEEFGMPYGTIVTGKLIAGIRKLGVDKVFDTSVGADFTTTEEAKEFIEKFKNKTLPCLSSCCPAWVRFVELNYPEFVPNLATTRSPQIILGGLIKTYWAQKQGIDPEKIIVVSVMPCVAKKYEITRKEFKIGKLWPVDYVLTTRELAHLFRKRNIDLKKIEPEKPDNPLGIPSGAGVIYGASGGVVESMMRIVPKKFIGKIAVVQGIRNAEKILQELKKNPKLYDTVEVMACPGGCIGGGGQPVPSDAKIREQRAKALYKIDSKKQIKSASDNPIVKKVYKDFLNSEKRINTICHTTYKV